MPAMRGYPGTMSGPKKRPPGATALAGPAAQARPTQLRTRENASRGRRGRPGSSLIASY